MPYIPYTKWNQEDIGGLNDNLINALSGGSITPADITTAINNSELNAAMYGTDPNPKSVFLWNDTVLGYTQSVFKAPLQIGDFTSVFIDIDGYGNFLDINDHSVFKNDTQNSVLKENSDKSAFVDNGSISSGYSVFKTSGGDSVFRDAATESVFWDNNSNSVFIDINSESYFQDNNRLSVFRQSGGADPGNSTFNDENGNSLLGWAVPQAGLVSSEYLTNASFATLQGDFETWKTSNPTYRLFGAPSIIYDGSDYTIFWQYIVSF